MSRGTRGGVNKVPLDINLHDDLFLLIASTVPRHTDALRLIDDVGLGWGVGGCGGVGGVNNVPLDINLHDEQKEIMTQFVCAAEANPVCAGELKIYKRPCAQVRRILCAQVRCHPSPVCGGHR